MQHSLQYNSASVVQGLEFSGFGPAVADTILGLRVNAHDMEFALSMNRDGTLKGFAPLWGYQNTLHPVPRAVLNIISHVFMGMSDLPFLENQITDDFESNGKIIARSTFLWMANPEEHDPAKRVRYVLNELIVGGDALWCGLRTMPYNTLLYQDFYEHMRLMLMEFKKHGKLPTNLTMTQLDEIMALCVPEQEEL
jgi:hypothetical protein